MSLGSAGITFYFSLRMNSPLNMLKKAIQNFELQPWIQPIISADGRVVGGEILVRWSHPEKGIIYPEAFIPLAEDNNLIIPVTQNLMKQVGEYFVDKVDVLPDSFHFAFNVSPEHFETVALLNESLNFILSFKPEKKIRLVLEVTERQQIKLERSIEVMERLQQNGILIALDDFGTGHSSLDYLLNLKFDIIKIDKSFVDDVINKIHVGNIIQNIVNLAKDLGVQTIAEGVETAEQLQELKKYNITYYQGYCFSRPVPLDVFSKMLLSG
jgi:EAL domain-containing protein (putative c-di-GMP-specific phosphodiesterase class I)